MRSYFVILAFTLFLAVGVIFSACRLTTVTTLPATSLADTSWILVSFGPPTGQTSVPAGRTITLNFRGLGGYDGSTGVNNYGGASRLEGDKFTVQGLTKTPDTDPVGDVYLGLLRQADSVEYQAGKLTIHCKDGQVLVFRPA